MKLHEGHATTSREIQNGRILSAQPLYVMKLFLTQVICRFIIVYILTSIHVPAMHVIRQSQLCSDEMCPVSLLSESKILRYVDVIHYGALSWKSSLFTTDRFVVSRGFKIFSIIHGCNFILYRTHFCPGPWLSVIWA